MLSVVIPTLNAAAGLASTLVAVQTFPQEVIVADGGSTDGTRAIATRNGARVLTAVRGRGSQLRAGVAAAQSPWLLLLHADTRLASGWEVAVAHHMRDHRASAGYFRFVLDSRDRRARILERLVGVRCRWLGLPYGDQALLIHRDLLDSIGGIRPLPLMEDVDLVRRLGRRRLRALDAAAITSAARWERDGWVRRSARNLACLGLWYAGVPARLIARLYG